MTSEELKTQLGRNVRNRRKELGLSQETLAVDVGVSQSQIANIELGKTWVSSELLVRLATSLRTEPQSFFVANTFATTTA